MSDPRDPDLEDDILPPERPYQWRLSNDITGDDWDALNAEHDRTGMYGDLLDEKIDLEFRLHDLKEKLGVIPPTPPKPKEPPKPAATPAQKTQTTSPKPAQSAPSKPQPAPSTQTATPKPTEAPSSEKPIEKSRRAVAEAKLAEQTVAPPRVLVTAAPPVTTPPTPPVDEGEIEAEVEAHPS